MSAPEKLPSLERIMLTTVQVQTWLGDKSLSNATGFFITYGDRLFLATSRHVFHEPANNHAPDKIVIRLHTDEYALHEYVEFSMPLYVNGERQWRQGQDGAGDVDVAVIEIDRSAFPAQAKFVAFSHEQIQTSYRRVSVGRPVLAIGYPLGFHDEVFNMPVARQAIIASSFGVRFQGQGVFLTDGRMHRGISGAPVVLRDDNQPSGELPWLLLGVHAAKFDVPTRDKEADDELGLNAVWYADILLKLME